MLVSKNNVVACKPFEVKQNGTKGLALVTKDMEVIPLFVLYPTNNGICVTTDDTIYVKAESHRLNWAKDRYRLAGSKEEFILVPTSEIVFVDKGAKTVN